MNNGKRKLVFKACADAFFPFACFSLSPHLLAPPTQASPDKAIVRNKPVVQVRIIKLKKQTLLADLNM